VQCSKNIFLKLGGVKEETRQWKEAAPVSVDADKPNEDFMMMSYEQRAFDTDRLEAPAGHVVTGVKLRNIGGHLNMEIQVGKIKCGFASRIKSRFLSA